jgi:hypothetical protein
VRFRPAAAACLLALTAACSHGARTPAPSSPAPSSPAASAALAALAQQAISASYTATYLAQTSDTPPRSSTITVYRTPTRTRLDVAETSGLVRIQVDPTGTYTCNVPATGKASCLTLAGAGQPVPANVDPSGQYLFTSTLDVFATSTGLTVAPAPAESATGGVPSVRCFAVNAGADPRAASGTYCFTATGIVARAQFRATVLQLTALGATPTDSDFTLPATPAPVAITSPTPSKS